MVGGGGGVGGGVINYVMLHDQHHVLEVALYKVRLNFSCIHKILEMV